MSRDLPAGFRPAVTHKSDRGPVHSVQVRPASLAEWQKQVRIGILGQIRREFSEIEARLHPSPPALRRPVMSGFCLAANIGHAGC
jgi:hypothetical protein